MHLYLIGYRGSGKSTVGRLVAEKLQRPLVDTDECIEKQAGKSIRDIFALDGESGFRELEQQVVADCAGRAKCEPAVVSLGGGAILREANQVTISASGRCVWLRGSPEVLYQRIQADNSTQSRRPNLSAYGGFKEVTEILKSREPIYERLAQKIVDIDSLSPDQIAIEIVDWIRIQSEPDCD